MGVGIAIRLPTHSKSSIGYYLWLLIQTQFQLDSYIHATYSLENLKYLIHSLAGLAAKWNFQQLKGLI